MKTLQTATLAAVGAEGTLNAIVHAVRCSFDESGVPSIRFSTTLTGGDCLHSAQHELSGDDVFALLRRARNYDVNDLDGRLCTVSCHKGGMEFRDFS